jgi:hypothetical protein
LIETDLWVLIEHQSPKVAVRVPPLLVPGADSSWVPTPPRWFLGTWYFTQSDSAVYNQWRNMQWTLTPQPSSGVLYDLVTYQFPGSNNTYSFSGLDTPATTNSSAAPTVEKDTYSYVPNGAAFASDGNSFSVIAWGYDNNSVAYAVLYESPTTNGQEGAVFDIISRSDNGPDQITLNLIYQAVNATGNSALISLKNGATPLKQDGGRNGQGYPTCDAACLANCKSSFG